MVYMHGVKKMVIYSLNPCYCTFVLFFVLFLAKNGEIRRLVTSASRNVDGSFIY